MVCPHRPLTSVSCPVFPTAIPEIQMARMQLCSATKTLYDLVTGSDGIIEFDAFSKMYLLESYTLFLRLTVTLALAVRPCHVARTIASRLLTQGEDRAYNAYVVEDCLAIAAKHVEGFKK